MAEEKGSYDTHWGAADEPQRTRRCPASAGRGGAFGPEPKKLQHSLTEFGAHGSLYKGWEKDGQNGGNA